MSIFSKLFSGGVKGVVDTVSGVVDKFVTTPDEKAAIKLALEQELNRHMETMEAQANEIEKAYLADVANARNMQAEALKQDDVFSRRFLYYLSAFLVITATGFGVGLFFMQVPEENKRMVEMFADIYLFGGAVTVINFFFGNAMKQK